MDSSNPWTRRQAGRGNKLSVSTSAWDNADKSETPRTPRRFGGAADSHTRSNPFNPLSSLSAANPTSQPSSASSAFGLGSGAFASFGSAGKTPSKSSTEQQQQQQQQQQQKSTDTKPGTERGSSSSTGAATKAWSKPKETTKEESSPSPAAAPVEDHHPLKNTWIVWYRPPTPKYSDYEKSTVALASISTVESFWGVYSHLKRPSQLPTVSDYHIFKKDIRPVWEDDANKRGGKWIVRLKKGVADRYWEELLCAIVGDQFGEAGEEVCGAVLSVRSGEDVLSVWTRIDGGKNIKIRETIKRLLAFPPDTNIVWKSHDDSIAQRAAVDQARHEKTQASAHSHHHGHHHNHHQHHHRHHDREHGFHGQGADRRRHHQQPPEETPEKEKALS